MEEDAGSPFQELSLGSGHSTIPRHRTFYPY